MPSTTTGSGAQTLQYGGTPKQIAIDNKNASGTLNIKINEDTVGITVEASGKRGWRINKGIYQVTITASGSWEVTTN